MTIFVTCKGVAFCYICKTTRSRVHQTGGHRCIPSLNFSREPLTAFRHVSCKQPESPLALGDHGTLPAGPRLR